jgi:hypothetical protein
MNRAYQLAWLAKGMMTTAVGLLLCVIMTPLVASGPEIQTVDSDGEAAPALIAYRKEPTAQSVLVGTSLTYRLKEQFFLPMQVRNLAIPGRSILNGLNIVASYPKLPTNIFVETNVMVWPTDDDFVKKFSYNPVPRFQFAPPIRSLVSYLNSLPNAGVRAPPVDESILGQPPAEYDNKIYIERAKVEWSGHKMDATILSNIDALARLVQQIEARGSRVYFFDLPLASGMADTDVVMTTKAAFAQRFTDTSRWLALKYPIEQLRFGDHAHLDDRSAIIVAHALRDAARHR